MPIGRLTTEGELLRWLEGKLNAPDFRARLKQATKQPGTPGPEGPQGPQGEQGETGPQGPQGGGNYAAGTLNVSTTGNKTVSGLSFEPVMVEFFPLVVDSAFTGNISEGVMTASYQSSVGIGLTGSDRARGSRTDACFILVASSGAIAVRAVRVSLNADGFTINVTSASSGVVPDLTWKAFG